MKKYEKLAKIDKSNMLALLQTFPEQCRQAVEIAEKNSFKPKKYENIFIQGMGGSGISGIIASSLLKNNCKVPIIAESSYQAPAFVNSKTLAFFVSYSGNTEETLASFNNSRKTGAETIAITSNGKLAKKCSCIKVPAGNPPRTMLGFLSLPLITTIQKTGLLNKKTGIEKLADFLEKKTSKAEEQGMRIAEKLQGKIPVIYASEPYNAAALRMHTQLAENSGVFSHWNYLPEANHNEIVGYAPAEEKLAFVFLRSNNESKKIKARANFTEKLCMKKSRVYRIKASGKTPFENLFQLILTGDFASYYLALLREKDPSEIKNISKLKKML